MCGICGIVGHRIEVDVESVRRMNAAMSHRGPDGEGEYCASHLAMAMRRLSIIGLNDGWQPIYNEDRSLAVLVNGEIYNYVELRAELESRGHRFSTHSDAETIVHLYEEQGSDCLHRLRGMFAIALWDERRKRLFLARDRMGEKPLYLAEEEGSILFASELKALLKSGKTQFEFDPVAVDLYFHYGYVPEPYTPLKGVRKLPAGHLMTIEVEPWNISERAYWRWEDIPPLEGDPATLIRQQLDELSSLVVRSDVPVGVALSGGLDSSAIAALAARAYPGVLQAFSVGYPGKPRNDERLQAAALAKTLNIPFHEVEISTEKHTDFFEELVFLRDDPIADVSGYGYYCISEKAREIGVPVLLQGHGGDELFWGYEWVRQAAMQTFRKRSRLVSGAWSAPCYLNLTPLPDVSARALLRWLISRKKRLSDGLHEWHRDGRSSHEEMVFINIVDDFKVARRDLHKYYSVEFSRRVPERNAERLFDCDAPWNDIPATVTRLITQTYLLENGIAQGDRLSMANSVELRLPLVDYRLVETVIGLRRRYPDHALPAKHWFKQALRGLLSDEIISRPKRGFAPPVREWHDRVFERHGRKLINGLLVQNGILTPSAGIELSEGGFPPVVVPVSFKALILELWARRMHQN